MQLGNLLRNPAEVLAIAGRKLGVNFDIPEPVPGLKVIKVPQLAALELLNLMGTDIIEWCRAQGLDMGQYKGDVLLLPGSAVLFTEPSSDSEPHWFIRCPQPENLALYYHYAI